MLRAAANTWIINDPVDHADAIVVLGGGLEYRPFAAARLFTNGVARTILIAQPQLAPTEEMKLRPTESATAREVLLKLGVPADAIQPLGTNVTSTRDEALALAAWTVEHHANSIAIPTDIFHTRRARWIFKKAVASKEESGRQRAEIHIMAVDAPRYTRATWWQREEGFIAFQNEVAKTLYYHLRY